MLLWRVWLNSFIMLMRKVLLWQWCGLIALLVQCEKCYYDTAIKKQQFISTHLLWQKIIQLQDKWILYTITCTAKRSTPFRQYNHRLLSSTKQFSEYSHPQHAKQQKFCILQTLLWNTDTYRQISCKVQSY